MIAPNSCNTGNDIGYCNLRDRIGAYLAPFKTLQSIIIWNLPLKCFSMTSKCVVFFCPNWQCLNRTSVKKNACLRRCWPQKHPWEEGWAIPNTRGKGCLLSSTLTWLICHLQAASLVLLLDPISLIVCLHNVHTTGGHRWKANTFTLTEWQVVF